MVAVTQTDRQDAHICDTAQVVSHEPQEESNARIAAATRGRCARFLES
jgi:hypothetical protein